jgi:hypothetical protein
MKKIILALLFICCTYAPLGAQALTNVLLPRYMEGVNGTNANRIPIAYRATITGLTAGDVYRYYNQIITSADGDSTDGAGNCIFASASGDFVRTSSPGFTKVGTYGVFTADAAGSYEGWFISEPTGNARFVPGRYVFMRVIMKDTTAPAGTVRRTTVDSVRVIKLATVVSDTTGTGLRCTSGGKAKDFVFVYDNTVNTGRPLSGTFIEGDGTANTTSNSYASFYSASVNEVSGAFGLVLPNALPNGVRLVEERSFATGKVVASMQDADGVWPSGTNTVNPSGGTTELVLSSTDVRLSTAVRTTETVPDAYRLGQNYPNPFNPSTTISFTLPTEDVVTLEVMTILGEHVATLVHGRMSAGTHAVHFDASRLASGIYFYRLSAGWFTSIHKMIVMK